MPRIALVSLVLLGSAAAGQSAPDRALLTADLLATADQAGTGKSKSARKAFAQAVATLDRIGVRADPADVDGQAALAEWRTRAGNAQPPMRGRVLGPAFRRGWLDAGARLQLEQLFLAGQAANVAVAAAPGEGMRLAISGPDAGGTCAGEGRSCRWTPIFTQRYTITVHNRGTMRARYYLVMD